MPPTAGQREDLIARRTSQNARDAEAFELQTRRQQVVGCDCGPHVGLLLTRLDGA
jgi:hypothetical protein